ncbi:hypothetical protein PSEUDO8Z_60756 [Pseudomonas sp. 8Z]|nr:hypothetical protein PSEUDO8Z_60756 [Pseudomonas sp. 8Z]
MRLTDWARIIRVSLGAAKVLALLFSVDVRART